MKWGASSRLAVAGCRICCELRVNSAASSDHAKRLAKYAFQGSVAGAVCGATTPTRMQGQRPAARRDMQRRPGQGRGTPRFGALPDYQQIAPPELRENPARLVEVLVERLFQDKLEPKQREAFKQYAVAKEGAGFTEREVAELVHLMTSTPYYQLT